MVYRLTKHDMSLNVTHWENIKGVVELALRSQTRPHGFRQFTQSWMALLEVGLSSGCS